MAMKTREVYLPGLLVCSCGVAMHTSEDNGISFVCCCHNASCEHADMPYIGKYPTTTVMDLVESGD